MSRVMILGGGSSQLSGIRRCREMGHHVIVADMNPDAPGCTLADEFARASTFDPKGVTRAAAEFRADGILTMGSDQPVLTQAIAAEALGLPAFLSPHQALMATNKKAMKNRLAEEGVPLAPFAILGTDECRIPDSIGLPAVMKPLDSQGQRGIFYLTERDIPREAVEETLSFSRQEEFIVEEFYPGGEVTLSGWLVDGRLFTYSITDRVTRHALPRLGVCFAHRYPSRYAQSAGEQIRSVAENALRALDIQAGPVYIQLFAGAAGVKINEVACRLGGAYEDEFIPRITGIDILDLLIRGTLGDKPGEQDVRPNRDGGNLYLSVPLMFCRPGTLAAWHGIAEARKIPGVETLSSLLPEGTVIRDMKNSTQRAAWGIISATSPEEANRSVETLFRTLRADDPEGENLLTDSRVETKFPLPFPPDPSENSFPPGSP